ncbi:MAG: hypothetical protein WBQ21_08030 [Solirubrobacteraceae bacterium]
MAVAFAVVGVPPASAAKGGPVWPAASRLELPSGAATKTLDQTPTLNSVACASPGHCVAVGSYNDTRHSARGVYDDQAMVVAETRGLWSRASKLMLPAGANLSAGEQSANLASVACTGPGSCIAVGTFTDSGGLLQPMVATETKGVWGRASEIAVPSDANATTADGVGLDSVACTSQGNCVAVGAYDDNSPGQQPMVAVEAGGLWSQASKLTLPSNADTNSGDQDAALDSVACTGPGSCVAVGSYADTTGSQQAMVATEASGVWSQASELTLPVGALESSEDFGECGNENCGQYAVLSSVACTGPGSCVAVGSYADATGGQQAMVASETSGIWGQASKLKPPPGAKTSGGNPGENLALGLHSVTCTINLGGCVAVGQYYAKSSGYEAMVATETSGVWERASKLKLPPGAEPKGQFAALDSVACTSPGRCVAVGTYSAHGNTASVMAVATSVFSPV